MDKLTKSPTGEPIVAESWKDTCKQIIALGLTSNEQFKLSMLLPIRLSISLRYYLDKKTKEAVIAFELDPYRTNADYQFKTTAAARCNFIFTNIHKYSLTKTYVAHTHKTKVMFLCITVPIDGHHQVLAKTRGYVYNIGKHTITVKRYIYTTNVDRIELEAKRLMSATKKLCMING